MASGGCSFFFSSRRRHTRYWRDWSSDVCSSDLGMTLFRTPADSDTGSERALREIEDRVLWLATAIVDHANRVRPNPGGLKVGGHQASSASMVTIMTSLWLEQLRAEDRVSVKPHASPVLHALEYLLGQLDASYLTTLREFGGLQSYPSRLKDPVPADYSTGSVGIGATAPIWGAIARRYVNTQLGAGGTGRQWSLVGDAELDEGAVWEAVLDPMVAELGEVVWVVDLNRQSLDRVVPMMGATRLQGMFAAAGWQVLTVKYGRLLEELFARPGGAALRHRIDAMSNPEYQRLLRHDPADLRRLLPGEGPGAAEIAGLIADLPDADLRAAVRNLGGHDPAALRAAFAQIDDTRPTVVLAYTLKGYGLATEGHPQNHSALLTEAQLHELAARVGADPADPWAGLPADGDARSEEHTSELQSRHYLVCRLLLEKKNSGLGISNVKPCNSVFYALRSWRGGLAVSTLVISVLDGFGFRVFAPYCLLVGYRAEIYSR